MLILEANLPVLPGERVDDLLLGALLSADLQSLIFTDSHTSANENNIAFDWPFWWRQSYEMTYWDRDFSLQSQRHTEQQAALCYKDIWSHTVQIFTAREWISSMLFLPLTWLPNPTMFGERTCRIQNCGSAVAALRENLRSKPAHFGTSHGHNLGSHDDIKDEDTRAPILLHIQHSQMEDKTLLGVNKMPGADLKVRNKTIQKTLAIWWSHDLPSWLIVKTKVIRSKSNETI